VPTVSDVAAWLLEQVQKDGVLQQDYAASEIQDQFGEDFIYENTNGNLAIKPDVLKAFRAISEKTVVWQSGNKEWRLREDWDEPTRKQ